MGFTDFTGNDNNNIPPSGDLPNSIQTFVHGEKGMDANDYIINYNEKFKNATPAIFRDELINQTMGVLIGKNKPNALLIGAAGVGKTMIVEDIARRLANHHASIPDTLIDSVIYELPLSNIVAGSGLLGLLEEKIKAVIEFMMDPNNKAILFIDEIHQLAGTSQIYQNIAQILKPALARGEMRAIGATTLQESNNLIEDPAFNRRFSRLIVDELTREQTVSVLENAKTGFIQHYGNKILIDDDILTTVATIADQYASVGSHRPDNALTLLDRSCGDAILARKVMEQKAQNDSALLNAIKAAPFIPITKKQIRQTAIKLMTGHSKRGNLDIDALKEQLEVIRGQDDILEQLIDIIYRDNMGLFKRERPLTLLFAGGSGVGKTEVTKIIATEMTGMPPITLNMTEFHSSASINRIIGSPAGYVGSDSHAELPFDKLESNPYQIILLDEFEKGDKAVQRLFMSAFEDGYIQTSKGKIVDFSKSTIIATTNAGFDETMSNSMGFLQNEQHNTSKQTTIDRLSNWFDIALLNRFNKTITFHELNKDIYTDIIAQQYKREIKRIKTENRSITLSDELSKKDLEQIVKDTYIKKFGARPARRAVQDYIESNV